jgi:hypothetical protein
MTDHLTPTRAMKFSERVDCPKCDEKAGEYCINLAVRKRRIAKNDSPTAWPHKERFDRALKELGALS